MTDEANQQREAVLLPCPFCGGEKIEVFHHLDRGWGASWHVECVAEECGNGTCHHDTEATAIAAWNTRAQTDTLKIAREALRGMIDLTSDYNLDSEQAGRAYAALKAIDAALEKST